MIALNKKILYYSVLKTLLNIFYFTTLDIFAKTLISRNKILYNQ